MRAEEKVYGWLTADSAIVALVGDRIEMDERTQAAELPNIVYQRKRTATAVALDGDHGFGMVSIEIEIQAIDIIAARELARLVRKCLRTRAKYEDGATDTDRDRRPPVSYYTMDFTVSEKEEIE